MTSTEATGSSRGAQAEDNVRNTARALKAVYRTPTPAVCEKLHISRATWFSKLRGTSPFTVGEVAEMSALWGVRVGDFYEGRVVLPDHRGDSGPENRRNPGDQSTNQSTNAWKSTGKSSFLDVVPDLPGQRGPKSPPVRGHLHLVASCNDQVSRLASHDANLGIA